MMRQPRQNAPGRVTIVAMLGSAVQPAERATDPSWPRWHVDPVALSEADCEWLIEFWLRERTRPSTRQRGMAAAADLNPWLLDQYGVLPWTRLMIQRRLVIALALRRIHLAASAGPDQAVLFIAIELRPPQWRCPS